MRSRNDWLTMSLALAAGAAVACGGATNGNTTASTEGGTEDGSLASADGGGGSSGASSGSSSGSSGDDEDAGDASLLIMGGSSSGSSSSSSSGAGSSGAPTPGDGGPDQIMCGAMGPCNSTSQVCCATKTGRQCVSTGTCVGDSLACSGSTSCTAGSGDVCCEELAANGTVRTRCDTACPAGSRQLCTSKADCKADEDCVRGLDGYGACVAVKRDGGAADAAGE